MRILSGIQPSGELHIGNWLGAVRNWVELQKTYRCFICIVDYHAITQDYDAKALAARPRDMATDIIACGVDPETTVVFVQMNRNYVLKKIDRDKAGEASARPLLTSLFVHVAIPVLTLLALKFPELGRAWQTAIGAVSIFGGE